MDITQMLEDIWLQLPKNIRDWMRKLPVREFLVDRNAVGNHMFSVRYPTQSGDDRSRAVAAAMSKHSLFVDGYCPNVLRTADGNIIGSVQVMNDKHYYVLFLNMKAVHLPSDAVGPYDTEVAALEDLILAYAASAIKAGA